MKGALHFVTKVQRSFLKQNLEPPPPKKKKKKKNLRIPGSAPVEKLRFLVFGYTFVLQQSGEYSRMVNNDR